MAVISGKKIESCKLLINNEWVVSQAQNHGDIFNPSTGEIIAKVPYGGKEDVNKAVISAHKAFQEWRFTPIFERARYMFNFIKLLEDNKSEIARQVTIEHGKTYSESLASVQRGIEMVEFACSIPTLIQGEFMENIARGVDCETVRQPIGVFAGITPFNFPAMVPLWMYPVAITCGNTFILKPSEKVPLTSILIANLLMESGLPAGVFNLVHGGVDCVNAILEHPQIRGISFVGSSNIAKYVYETGTKNGKRVQAAGGAKNHLIIMPDANLDLTTHALKASAFGCSGQRCMAGSLAVTVGEIHEPIMDNLVNIAQKMTVGRTDNSDTTNEPDMGPVISQEHMLKVKNYIATGVSEGASLRLDGRNVNTDTKHGFYIGPTIFDKAKPDMKITKEEIFGPVLTVIPVKTLDEALELGNDCDYGNGAVIFTSSGASAREFKHKFNAGMIGVNVGVPAPLAWFSFSGWNSSFFGDLHIQGKEAIYFYTQQKLTMTRWFDDNKNTAFKDPIWKQNKKE